LALSQLHLTGGKSTTAWSSHGSPTSRWMQLSKWSVVVLLRFPCPTTGCLCLNSIRGSQIPWPLLIGCFLFCATQVCMSFTPTKHLICWLRFSQLALQAPRC
jgi:hypothetical protein